MQHHVLHVHHRGHSKAMVQQLTLTQHFTLQTHHHRSLLLRPFLHFEGHHCSPWTSSPLSSRTDSLASLHRTCPAPSSPSSGSWTWGSGSAQYEWFGLHARSIARVERKKMGSNQLKGEKHIKCMYVQYVCMYVCMYVCIACECVRQFKTL